MNLTDELFQRYVSVDSGTEVEVLYNDSYDYFYFNVYYYGSLVKGDTPIVNNYNSSFVSFTSSADSATLETVTLFTIEVKSV